VPKPQSRTSNPSTYISHSSSAYKIFPYSIIRILTPLIQIHPEPLSVWNLASVELLTKVALHCSRTLIQMFISQVEHREANQQRQMTSTRTARLKPDAVTHRMSDTDVSFFVVRIPQLLDVLN